MIISFVYNEVLLDIELSKTGISYHPQVGFDKKVLQVFKDAENSIDSYGFGYHLASFDAESLVYSKIANKKGVHLYQSFVIFLYKLVMFLYFQGISIKTIMPDWLLEKELDWFSSSIVESDQEGVSVLH